MPKSKRSKVVSLTKVAKKTKENKVKLVAEIQAHLEKWDYCWLFDIPMMRNTHLKTIRSLWKNDGRIFFGRSAVMAKALGTSSMDEFKPGLHKLAEQIQGQIGLLLTSSPPQEVLEWFEDFHQADFARAGTVCPRSITLPAGPVMRRHSDPPEPFPHNEEPQLRKLGLTTTLIRGVPSLASEQILCKEGDILTAEQCQLLKLIGEKMVDFRVVLIARWEKDGGNLVQVKGRVGGQQSQPQAGNESSQDDDDEEEG